MIVIMAAIDSGDINVEGGNKLDVPTSFIYRHEPHDFGAINLIVR